MTSIRANAIYDDALARTDFEHERSIVLDGLVQQGVHYDGRPVCDLLRPFIVDAAEKSRRDHISELVARGVRIAVEQAAKHAALRRALLLTGAEEEAVQFEAGATSELFARLDGLIDPSGTLKFIEYNPFPSGFAWADKIAERFEATAAYRACAARFELVCQRMIPRFARALLAHVAHLPLHGARSVGIVAPASGAESVDAVPEIALVLEEVLRAGIQVRIADPDGLSLAADALLVGGEHVDAVFVTRWDGLLTPEAKRRSPLWRARQAGTVVLLDSPSTTALHGAKGIFALLSDPEYEPLFPDDVRAVLRRHVPWTRCVAPVHTTYRGERIDLLPWLRAQRANLVLKPAHAFGGIGVHLGWEASESAWDAAIAEALRTPYVVQERAIAGSVVCPIAGARGLEQRNLLYDWNPVVWNDGRAYGGFSRLGEQSILNVKAGASLVPIFAATEL